MKNKIVLIIILLLVLVRLAMAFPAFDHPERFRVVDSDQYVDLASTLLKTGEYHGTLYPYPEINLIRPPVYPLFLALNIFLFSDVRWASLVQVLLTFLNAFVIYRIGSDLDQRKAGVAAVLLYLLSVNGAFEALQIMTETLTSTWVLLAFWGLVRHQVTHQRRWFVFSGAMMGMGALARPILFPLLLGWSALLLLLEINWKPRVKLSKTAAGNALLFAMSGMVFILPWQVRNYRVHGQFTLSDVSRVTIENYMMANVVAEVNGISRNEAVALIDAQPDPASYRIQFIKAHLPIFFKVQSRGIIRTFVAVSYPSWAEEMTGIRPPSTGVIQNFKLDTASLVELLKSNLWLWLGITALAISAVMYVMGAVSVWHFFTRYRQEPIFPLVVVTVITTAYLMLSPLGQGDARFRVPVEPLLALLAGLWFYTPVYPDEYTKINWKENNVKHSR